MFFFGINILKMYYTFFCDCAKTQDLCNSFASDLGENLDLLQLSSTIVFLGEPNIQDNDNVLLNHILLLFKNQPARIHFLSFMKYIIEVKN